MIGLSDSILLPTSGKGNATVIYCLQKQRYSEAMIQQWF